MHLAAGMVLWLALSGCIDPIDLDLGPPERRLVVEGEIIEGPGPHEVILSRSAAYGSGTAGVRFREQGAHVRVLVGDGSEYVLEEIAPGRYHLEEDALVAVPGQSYALRIELADGSVYASAAETMLEATRIIDLRVRSQMEERVVHGHSTWRPYLELEVTGAVHYARRQNYFRWTWQGGGGKGCPPEPVDSISVRIDNRSALHLADDALSRTSTVRHRMRSVEVTPRIDGYLRASGWDDGVVFYMEQQALTADAYAYLSLIRQMRDNVGSLFDTMPVPLVGNVLNEANPQDAALGYFVVAGASHKTMCCTWSSCRDPDEEDDDVDHPGPRI